ncbi:MAG TPA: hypothetical protein VJ873_09775, partial [bacterium]|nr:hypothetical protein [bacterium]
MKKALVYSAFLTALCGLGHAYAQITPTFTLTPTPTHTPTGTYILTDTPTNTSTYTPTNTSTCTSSNTPTNTATTDPGTATPSQTPTNSVTPTTTVFYTLQVVVYTSDIYGIDSVVSSPAGVSCVKGASSGSCSATFMTGTAVTLTTNGINDVFTGFTGSLVGQTNVLTMDQNSAVTAWFEMTTSTPTGTATSTMISTATGTPTNTPTNSPSHTPTGTCTSDPTQTPTRTATSTRTNTPTQTTTNTPSNTATPTGGTSTPTNTPTADPGTATSTFTITPSPTATGCAVVFVNSPTPPPTVTASGPGTVVGLPLVTTDKGGCYSKTVTQIGVSIIAPGNLSSDILQVQLWDGTNLVATAPYNTAVTFTGASLGMIWDQFAIKYSMTGAPSGNLVTQLLDFEGYGGGYPFNAIWMTANGTGVVNFTTLTATFTNTPTPTITYTPTQTPTGTIFFTGTPTNTPTSTLLIPTPACAGATVMGYTTYQFWNSIPASTVAYVPVLADGTGTVSDLHFYISAYSGVTIKLGIYSDNGGQPGTLLSSTNSFPTALFWNTATLNTPLYVTGGTNYWLAVWVSSNLFYGAGSGGTYLTQSGSGLPSSYGGGASSNSGWLGIAADICPATATPTFTFTPTNTPTGTWYTSTFTNTPTPTCTFTPSNTPTGCSTCPATNTFTWTPTRTNTYTPTATWPVTVTITPTFTFTPTPTPTGTWYTSTPTDTPTFTITPTSTDTPTGCATCPATSTFSWTPTPTNTHTPTATFSVIITYTPTSTLTTGVTITFTPTTTLDPGTFTWTPTPSTTPTHTRTNTPTMTGTAATTFTYTNTPTHTPSNTPVGTWFTSTPTKTGTTTPTFTPSNTPTTTYTFTPTFTMTCTMCIPGINYCYSLPSNPVSAGTTVVGNNFVCNVCSSSACSLPTPSAISCSASILSGNLASEIT